MKKVNQALQMFKEGFLCSQAIVATYGPQFDLDEAAALKISAGLGGGMAGKGQACGAVSGAVLVLGLAKGHVTASDKRSKAATYSAVSQFLTEFEQVHGSVTCNHLLGCDIGTADGLDAAKKGRLFETRCPQFVSAAAELLERILAASPT